MSEKVKKQDEKNELIKLTVRVPKYKKEMMLKVIEKSTYNNLADLIRAGIDKELNLQIYKDNLDFIIKELSKIIDVKLDPFIKSQRKINAKNLRTNAINTYLVGEVFSKILGDDMHTDFLTILSSAKKKANYFVNKDTTGMTEKDLFDFYYIGDPYRNE